MAAPQMIRATMREDMDQAQIKFKHLYEDLDASMALRE